MIDLLNKLGIDPSLQGSELLSALEREKQKAIRRFNNSFGNPTKEMEINILLKEIEDAISTVSQKEGSESVDDYNTGIVSKRNVFKIDDVVFEPKTPHGFNSQTTENVEKCLADAFDAYENGDFETAFNLYNTAAQSGDSYAMNALALFYEVGFGVEPDADKAFYWLKKAADAEYPDAMQQIGEMYYNGTESIHEDKTEAIKWLKKSAEKGNTDAMFRLALMYLLGDDIEKNEEQAFDLFKCAADNGRSDAFAYLGDFYLEGISTEQNYSKAFNSYMTGAENGSVYACYKLGVMFDKGLGMPKSHSDAIAWYSKAADGEYADALMIMGFAYLDGDNVEVNYEKSFDCFSKAALTGYVSAHFALGIMYEGGYGVQKNPFKAFECYKYAADKGLDNAQYNLGICYAKGLGVAADYGEAVFWMQEAASQDCSKAKEWLKNEKINSYSSFGPFQIGKNELGVYQFAGDIINGTGEIQYISGKQKGAIYKGEFKNGKFNGQGIYYISPTDYFIGTFVNGMNGNLVHKINDRKVFEGEFRDGLVNGMGIRYNDDGTTFQGEFVKGSAVNGRGTLHIKNSNGDKVKLNGEFLNGNLNGYGSVVNITQSYRLEGNFVDGKVNGDATKMYSDGRRIVGNFQNGSNGYVKFYDKKNRLIYEGGYNGSCHGHGIQYNSDGSTLKGEWNNGKLIRGQGANIYKHNCGITVKDKGDFINGELNGKGRRYFLSGEDSGGYLEGNFFNGTLEGPAAFHNKYGGREEVQCVKGVFQGPSKVYSAAGVLCWESYYKDGEEVGPRKETAFYRMVNGR